MTAAVDQQKWAAEQARARVFKVLARLDAIEHETSLEEEANWFRVRVPFPRPLVAELRREGDENGLDLA